MAQRLDIASQALEKAWQLNSHDPDICIEMMRVELGQGKGRQRLETWFQRGMKLNPASWNLCAAKLEYLRPRWYGTIPDMVQFGWQCMTNPDWSGEVRLGLVNAHDEASCEMPNTNAIYAYFAQPKVWSEIRSNFEYFFKLYPQEVGYRHNYARYAIYAQDWDEFLRQVQFFPATNFTYFGGTQQFDQYLEFARKNSKAKGPTK
jgi:hypothetical protein